MPVLATGARLVWADIDPWTGNIDPVDVSRKISARTKAVICVHWGGYPCDLHHLNAVIHAAPRHISLIEDACHATGAVYHGKPIGSHSDFVCFSFQAIKHMTTVDGGLLVCKKKEDCERGRLLRWYGIDRQKKGKDLRCEANIQEWGYKFHMNDVAATIGLAQLKHLDAIIAKHQTNAYEYNSRLKCDRLAYQKDRQSSYWLYTIRMKRRDEFVEAMKEAGIMASKVHVRNDIHTAFAESWTELPGLDEFYAEQVSIPVGWWVSAKDRNRIIQEVNKYYEYVSSDTVRCAG
jgi:dTDP-4-amino-4,6-dideoxygalactose transaminase